MGWSSALLAPNAVQLRHRMKRSSRYVELSTNPRRAHLPCSAPLSYGRDGPIPHEAFAQVRNHLCPVMVYLDRLRVRREGHKYTPADSLLRAIIDARDRLQAVTVELHY